MRHHISYLASFTVLAAACSSGGGSTTQPGTVAVATVAVTPKTASVAVGATSQLGAATFDASGNALTGRTITWSSGSAATATVSGSGLVTGVAAGTAYIKATSEGKSDSALVTVTTSAAAVAKVTVTPKTASVAVAATSQLAAATFDAAGNTLTGRTITWSSASAATATVSGTGLVTGVAAGSTYIKATSEGKSDSAQVTVTAAVSGTVAPFLSKPFTGEFIVRNPMDHDTPQEFVDTNSYFVASWGERINAFSSHAGYDFSMPQGTPILAAAPGTVTLAGSTTFYCPLLATNVNQISVIILHNLPDGSKYQTYYAHLSRVDVTVGATVTTGQQLGLSGNTGCTTAPHLHFELDRITGTNNGQVAQADPYGWTGTYTDPWQANPAGTKSIYLWLPNKAPQMLVGLDTNNTPLNNQYSGPSKKPVGISVWSFVGGIDSLTPNNEFVEVKIDPSVTNATTYDLTGHYIKNNNGDRYNFPSGTTLTSASPIRVYTGSGTNTATTLYWGKSSGIYNDLADCAELWFPNGGYYLVGTTSCK